MRRYSIRATVCADCLRGLRTTAGRRYNGVTNTAIGKDLLSGGREWRRGIVQVPLHAKRQRTNGGIPTCLPGVNSNSLNMQLEQQTSVRGMSNGMSTHIIVYKQVESSYVTGSVLICVWRIM